MTPQARAIKALEADDYVVDVVERINRIGKIVWRNDLFGCFDLLAIGPVGEVRAIQVTSRSNVSARVKKLTEKEDNAALAALGKSEGKVTVKELPAGTGFLVCMVKVSPEFFIKFGRGANEHHGRPRPGVCAQVCGIGFFF